MANAGFILMNGRRGTTRAPRQNLTAKEYLAERMAAKPEAAAIERAKLMTREERARAGIDCMTRDMLNDAQRSGDNRATEESIRSEVVKIAERTESKRDAGDV